MKESVKDLPTTQYLFSYFKFPLKFLWLTR